MDYLKKHYEKIAIALLLAFLTYSVISQIVFTTTIESVVVEWKPGKDVAEYSRVDSAYNYVYTPEADFKPFGGTRYLHCNNEECFYVMKDDNTQCPWCKAPIYAGPTVGSKPLRDRDDDKDGLPTKVELEHDLDPKDPSDANADKDDDGFSNLIEFKAGTDLSNPKDFPALARLLQLRGVYNLYLDFVIDSVTVYDPNDKKKWEIQVKERKQRLVNGSLRSFVTTSFKMIGDELPGGVKIIDATDSIDEGSTVTLKQGDEEFVVKANSKKILPPDAQRAEFIYSVGKNVQKIILKEGQEFVLKGKNGVPQTYYLEELSLKEKAVLVVDDINGEFPFKVEAVSSSKKSFDVNSFLEEIKQ